MRKLHVWKNRGLKFKGVVLVPIRVQQFRQREVHHYNHHFKSLRTSDKQRPRENSSPRYKNRFLLIREKARYKSQSPESR